MAEYYNGVGAQGNMSVSADRVAPDVQTGRVVFVDSTLYENNEGYKAKVDQCIAEGFHQVEVGASGATGATGATSATGATGATS